MADPTLITADEAVEVLTATAFEITDEESERYGEKIIHCFAGMLGADWPLQTALDLLETAQTIAWINHWASHDLAVMDAEGKVRFFDVKRPTTSISSKGDGQ
ncbi:hypothetical protein Ppa06_57710 [Planomonospora parontospora subsp. parontospora]|uniref:Uncharacterized protein n=2 Tax=Planomonospora parontospora TaxID=58119 RepID=A0AA37BMD6_9ACTN|nr:hypothetical protein [Planomonospora parontospora]GGK90636.1 hypothetical protein GCM10010126_57600 [Planomonospora parontospora]GII11973.1 hypothetical protein Ppa06_57710 [Planomonospora parontospora subsp. parontospora]